MAPKREEVMANRAYLYSADCLDPWPRHHEPYYDSRWAIPLAWFFFYRPSDVYMAEVRFEESSWQEAKLAAEKDSAVALFKARQSLLLAVLARRLSANVVERFANTVGGRPGRFLLLDPVEVLGGSSEDDAWHAGQFTRILNVLKTGGVSPEAVLEVVGTYVGSLEPDLERLSRQVIGYTYWE